MDFGFGVDLSIAVTAVPRDWPVAINGCRCAQFLDSSPPNGHEVSPTPVKSGPTFAAAGHLCRKRGPFWRPLFSISTVQKRTGFFLALRKSRVHDSPVA